MFLKLKHILPNFTVISIPTWYSHEPTLVHYLFLISDIVWLIEVAEILFENILTFFSARLQEY